MNNLIKSPFFFVLAYIPFLVLTYVLPYYGSNSLVSIAMVAALSTIPEMLGLVRGGQPILLFVLFHIFSLVALSFLAFYRGKFVQLHWLWILPMLAGIFDFIPVLSSIPLIPTLLHLAALVVGLIGSQKQNEVRV